MSSTSARNALEEIESILLEHPFVSRASVSYDNGPAGQKYLMAYVVPSPAWTEATKSQANQVNDDKRVSHWQKIFDRTYHPHEDNAPDFVGWTDSYTNSAIPAGEMQEWLDATVERITELKPERVLEVGCGVGLLVQKVAPKCRTYIGSDLSDAAISRLRKFVAARPELNHVELNQREAMNFDGLAPNSVDMVVLNSVVQYFPHLDYLRNVLKRAADVVVPGGHIFIGDVRHLGLLQVLHGSVQLSKAPPEANVRWLKRKIALAVEQERELVIDPQFFRDLPQSVSGIAGAEILLKRGRANNELTRYRYDVVLHVGETKLTPFRQIAEWPAGDKPIADLVSRFEECDLPSVCISGIVNKRLAQDLAAVHLLNSAHEHQSIKELKKGLERLESTGVDPEAVWQSLDLQTYDVRLGWSVGSAEGRFDVTLFDRNRCSGGPLVRPFLNNPSGACSTPLATDPLAAAHTNRLGLELGEMLRTRLPESLLSGIVVTTAMLEGRDYRMVGP